MKLLGLSVSSRFRPRGTSHQLTSISQRLASTSELSSQVVSRCQMYVSSRELSCRMASSCQWYVSPGALRCRGFSSCQRYVSTSALSQRGTSSCQRYASTSAVSHREASSCQMHSSTSKLYHQVASSCQKYASGRELDRRVESNCQRNASTSALNCRVWGSSSWFLRPSNTAIISVRLGGSHSSAQLCGQQARVKPFSEIPAFKPLAMVGNLIRIFQQGDANDTLFHKVWEFVLKESGPLFKVNIPGRPTMLITTNPDDIETFFNSTMDVPTKEVFLSLKTIQDNAHNDYFQNKNGLLCGNGKEWHRLRSRVQGTLLKPVSVASYLPQVDKTTKAYMERIDSLQAKTGRVPDSFVEDIYLWALECLCHIVMDRELGCLEPGLRLYSVPMRTMRHVTDLFTAMYDLENGPKAWMLYKTNTYVKMETAHSALLGIAVRTIEEVSKRLAGAKEDPHRTRSMMETLLSTEGLSKSDLVSVIMDMFVGSVDTTSHSLAFMLYHLAMNPKAQKKLQEEVDTVLGDATDLLPEHINGMTYLSYVVKESLRLHPIAIGNTRNLQKDVVMSGYKVPAGTMAVGANMKICNDEKYFHRAKEFLPERWARDRPYGPIHPFASLPFSYGTRMCIGKMIAEQEMYTFLIRAMQKYTITFESSRKMKILTIPFVKPTIPLPFKFHHRRKVVSNP